MIDTIERCIICTDKIKSNSNKKKKIRTSCGHKFHDICLIKYFSFINDTPCPLCRKKLKNELCDKYLNLISIIRETREVIGNNDGIPEYSLRILKALSKTIIETDIESFKLLLYYKDILDIDKDLDKVVVKDRTLLMLATDVGKPIFFKELVNNGFSIESVNDMLQNCLMIAIGNSNMHIIDIIMKCGGDILINKRDSQSRTIIHYAIHSNNLQTFKYVLKMFCKKNNVCKYEVFSKIYIQTYRTYLIYAVRFCTEIDIIKYILRRTCDKVCNSKDFEGKTALATAVETEDMQKYVLLRNNNLVLNTFDIYKESPLIYCAENGNLEMMKKLIIDYSESDVETSVISITNMVGYNLFTIAGICNNFSICEYLVNKFGYKAFYLNHKYKFPYTPLSIAVVERNYKFIYFLISYCKVDINEENLDKGETAFQIACICNYLEICDILIENDANINSVNMLYLTPMHYAAMMGETKIIKYLIDKGASLDSEDVLGETPLIKACKYNKKDCAQLLLNAGADINHTCIQGESSLIKCCERKYYDIMKFLIKNRCDLYIKNDRNESAFTLSILNSDEIAAKIIFDSFKV